MAEPDCWLQNSNVREQLTEYFAEIDKDLSTYYEENPRIREEHIESRLATLLEAHSDSRLQLPLSRAGRERQRLGLNPVNLKIKVTHITPGETRHGADIGLVAELDVPGEYRLTKATLIQSKHLYPDQGGQFHENSEYKEVFANGKDPQWERMLEVTPSSVYFLYNPHKIRMERKIKLVGTRVVTAQYVAGRASAIQQPRVTAQDAFRQGKLLSEWLIEDFICCRMGDTREEVVKTARGDNPRFPVRYTISVFITGVDVNPQLFIQRV